MNVLVTGAAGFIGSNFVYHYLESEPEGRVVGVDALTYSGNLENLSALPEASRQRFEFVKADICDRPQVEGLLKERQLNAVVHFAAESHVDRSIQEATAFLKTNVLGTQILLDAARAAWRDGSSWLSGVKFVQVSTDEVYGELGPKGSFSEQTPLAPRNPYSASKAAADHLVSAAHHTHGLPACITRCSNNYGPYQFPEKLIPLMIRNALKHETLPVYGDGRQVRDWLFVRDHCRAIELVLASGAPGRVYNIGGNNERENIVVVNHLLDVLSERTGDGAIGPALVDHVTDRPGHDRRYAIDASRIRTELGWAPTITFEEGIVSTIDWYLDNSDWCERVISGEYLDFYEHNYAHR